MSLRPLKPDAFDYWKARHLLNRAGFGGTPGQIRALADMGLHRAVEYIVDYHAIEAAPIRMDAFDKDIMKPLSRQERDESRRAGRSGDEATVEKFRMRRQAAQKADRRQIADLQKWWLTRMIETPRPLEEKMTLFWHGHFATGYRAIEDSYHMFVQNQLFRSHAVGNFKTLVHGIIRDPAMLEYLNNDRNRKSRPNENLARELMELFTLGEGNDYTEKDIKEGARALTGYTFLDDDFIDLQSREFSRRHDQEVKQILGRSGAWDGDDFVEIIFTQRACSEFICWKLYRFFVNDLPNGADAAGQQCITAMAKVFRDSKYQLRPVLEALFVSEHFYDPSNVGAQIKSPTQLIVQAVRSLRTPTRRLSSLLSAADLMGQDIFYPPSVKGWEGGRSWINTSTVFVRQNVMIYLLTGRRAGTLPWQDDGGRYDASHLIEHLRSGRGEIDLRDTVVYLLRLNLASTPHPERVESLVRFASARGGRLDNAMLIALLSLITAMPEYQLC